MFNEIDSMLRTGIEQVINNLTVSDLVDAADIKTAVPETSGVYMIFSNIRFAKITDKSTGELCVGEYNVIYVGTAQKLRTRLMQHLHRTTRFAKTKALPIERVAKQALLNEVSVANLKSSFIKAGKDMQSYYLNGVDYSEYPPEAFKVLWIETPKSIAPACETIVKEVIGGKPLRCTK